MGNPKQKWTSEEEEALKAGIAKHGTGKWKDIQRDPEFHPFLSSRSNIDLKDKWRNMSISAGLQGSRDKSRTSKTQANSDAHPAATQVSTWQPSVAVVPLAAVVHDATAISAVDDSSKGVSDGKTAPLYNAMIFEVLSTSKDPNGLETSKIVSFIEQRLKVPPNFRKLLSSRLRRLVAQGKIEKVQNYYKMKSDALSGIRIPVVKQESQPKRLQNVGQKTCVDPIEEAALTAASRIAEAENKAFELAETIKEQERISKMIEENQTMLHFAKELFERCSTGEILQIR